MLRQNIGLKSFFSGSCKVTRASGENPAKKKGAPPLTDGQGPAVGVQKILRKF